MRTITLEEHVTTPDLAKAAQMPDIGAARAFMQTINAKLLDIGEGRIADMDAAGIDMQVLSVAVNTLDKLDSATANDLAHDANDRKEHPGAQTDFIQWLGDNGYPSPGGHAGVMDTSEMLYLGGDKGWVRTNLVATAVHSPAGGQNNGITGDARRSSAELGEKFVDMKVDYAVRQINQLLAAKPAATAR